MKIGCLNVRIWQVQCHLLAECCKCRDCTTLSPNNKLCRNLANCISSSLFDFFLEQSSDIHNTSQLTFFAVDSHSLPSYFSIFFNTPLHTSSLFLTYHEHSTLLFVSSSEHSALSHRIDHVTGEALSIDKLPLIVRDNQRTLTKARSLPFACITFPTVSVAASNSLFQPS